MVCRSALVDDVPAGRLTILTDAKVPFPRRVATGTPARTLNPQIHRRNPSPQDARRRNRDPRSEEHTSELQSRLHLVCRLLLEKKKQTSPQALDRKAVATRHNAA